MSLASRETYRCFGYSQKFDFLLLSVQKKPFGMHAKGLNSYFAAIILEYINPNIFGCAISAYHVADAIKYYSNPLYMQAICINGKGRAFPLVPIVPNCRKEVTHRSPTR